MAGVLTQLDTPTLAADYAWDWGMGWGWSGYSASYCSTCAMEQAALMNSNIGHSSNVESITAPSTEIPSNTNIQDYLNSYDGDDNEIGELGEATDVGCDFGDFGFQFIAIVSLMSDVLISKEICVKRMPNYPSLKPKENTDDV